MTGQKRNTAERDLIKKFPLHAHARASAHQNNPLPTSHQTEVKFKSVPVCCEGYAVQEVLGNGSAEARCLPYCKRCRNGVCTAPAECTCDPGFQGEDCSYGECASTGS